MKILILISLLGLIACGKKVEDTTIYAPYHDQAIAFINEFDGSSCTEDVPSCTYTLVKEDTQMGEGWIVYSTSFEDNGQTETQYHAVNLKNYDESLNRIRPEKGEVNFVTASSLEDLGDGTYGFKTYSAYRGEYFIDDNGTDKSGNIYAALQKDGTQRLQTSHALTPGDWNNGYYDDGANPIGSALGLDNLDLTTMVFSTEFNYQKDLEKLASNIETEELMQFGLSIKTAKLVKTLANTAGKRALTKREKDLFTKELTGLSFEKAAEMMVEDYDGLLEKAAELNETSPEAIKELINTIM